MTGNRELNNFRKIWKKLPWKSIIWKRKTSWSVASSPPHREDPSRIPKGLSKKWPKKWTSTKILCRSVSMFCGMRTSTSGRRRNPSLAKWSPSKSNWSDSSNNCRSHVHPSPKWQNKNSSLLKVFVKFVINTTVSSGINRKCSNKEYNKSRKRSRSLTRSENHSGKRWLRFRENIRM